MGLMGNGSQNGAEGLSYNSGYHWAAHVMSCMLRAKPRQYTEATTVKVVTHSPVPVLFPTDKPFLQIAKPTLQK